MARNVTQLFVKGEENPWAEVRTDQYGVMTVVVFDEDKKDYIIIKSKARAEQLAEAIGNSAFYYQEVEEVSDDK